jgi:hypothetical protein
MSAHHWLWLGVGMGLAMHASLMYQGLAIAIATLTAAVVWLSLKLSHVEAARDDALHQAGALRGQIDRLERHIATFEGTEEEQVLRERDQLQILADELRIAIRQMDDQLKAVCQERDELKALAAAQETNHVH